MYPSPLTLKNRRLMLWHCSTLVNLLNAVDQDFLLKIMVLFISCSFLLDVWESCIPQLFSPNLKMISLFPWFKIPCTLRLLFQSSANILNCLEKALVFMLTNYVLMKTCSWLSNTINLWSAWNSDVTGAEECKQRTICCFRSNSFIITTRVFAPTDFAGLCGEIKVVQK